jgi:hypothetical protein
MKKTLILWIIIIQANVTAQEVLELDMKTKEEIVDSIASVMKEKYVFPDIGEKMADFINTQFKNGEYNSFTEVEPFCVQLTTDLRTIIVDKHLWIYYDPEESYEILADKNMLPEEEIRKVKERYHQWHKRQNYGFQKVEVLKGNIGYLKLNYFSKLDGAETCAGAMAILANTDAIIIDLRDNGGGENIGFLLSSYFFTTDRVLLGTVNFRDSTQNETLWTLPYIPGKRMPNTPLYILTSSRTFSAAESFTYNMQQLKRAVVVGETTKGGAHPIDVFIIKGNILAQVPIGSSYNPISKANWEGTGVIPDVLTTSDQALNAAYVMALDSLIKQETDKDIILKLDWEKKGAAYLSNPLFINEKTLEQYVGQYGNRIIMIKNNNLFFLPGNQSEYRMIPLEKDLFMIEGIDYFRIQFDEVINGRAKRLVIMYDDGFKQTSERK